MPSPAPASVRVRFGVFELDCALGRLRKNGIPIKLQPQPLRILQLLIERNGTLVTREEIRHQIWSGAVFVDFEHSINFSINQIRGALGDDTDHPRYIETIPKRGYRFIAKVSGLETRNEAQNYQTADLWPITQAIQEDEKRRELEASASNVPRFVTSKEINSQEAISTPPPPRVLPWWQRRIRFALLVLGACFVSSLLTYWLVSPVTVPKVTRYLPLTRDGAIKIPSAGCCPPTLVSDGSRVYFTEKPAGAWQVSEVSIKGGQVGGIPTPFQHANNVVFALSPVRPELLVSPWEGWELATPLWAQSLPSGAARRIGGLLVNDASWSPDGNSIIYGKGHELFVAKADGSESRKVAILRGIVYLPRQSPDGNVYRTTLYDINTGRESIWEISADGADIHSLLPDGDALADNCCGNWTPDGKYFVFQSSRDGATQIYAIRERGHLFQRSKPEPVQLTTGAMDFLAPSLSPDGQRLFAIGKQPRGELMRYDPASKQFVAYFSGISAQDLDFSRKDNLVAYVTYPEGVLWRQRIDGTDQLQLTDPSLQAASPSISPDGKWIAFMGVKPNGAWKIYLISTNGGGTEQLLGNQVAQWNPSWSPDGNFLAFGESLWSANASIHLLDMRTRQVSTLPRSEGLCDPRWSPDGRFILATTTDSLRLLLFDMKSKEWQELAHGQWFSSPTWSRAGDSVYFCDLQEPATPFYRVRIADHKLEHVVDVHLPRGLAGGLFGRWTGLAHDDSPLVLGEVGTQEIFSLDVYFP